MSVPLGVFVADAQSRLLGDLAAGRAPSVGEFDQECWANARTKGQPRIGTVRYEPHAVLLEFIFPDPLGSTAVLTVRLAAPERIVHLPVPEWVVENVWQGDVAGSFHFESHAAAMLRAFEGRLEPTANAAEFAPRTPIGRE